MKLLLVAALVVVPLVELYLLIQVGSALGALPTLALLVAGSLLGAWLLRREGMRTWAAFQAAATRGSLPAAEVADGALVLLGGALMLTPGFATDLVGVACVLPPSRALLRRVLLRTLARRALHGLAGMPRRTGRVVDGETARPRFGNDDGPRS